MSKVDDKELREKIDGILGSETEVPFSLSEAWLNLIGSDKNIVLGLILALLQPKIEEARRQGIRQAIDNLKMHHCIIDVEARIKEIEGESDRTNRRTG